MVKYNFLEKTIRNLWNSFNKSNTICQLLIIIAITYILFHISNKYDVKTEGFSQPSKFVTKENNDLYDDFYCSIYDDLVYDTTRNEFEVQEITNIAKINKNSNILDIGSGKGHHVNHFRKHGINVTGLDKSKSMIKLSQKKYPKCKFKHGDALNAVNFNSNTFTHITCLFFTIYYIENKKLFFKNVYDWLKPGGFLVLHLVNRDKFDPILNTANPLHLVSPQKFAKKRITNSLVKFNDFSYKANFKLNKQKDNATFIETFKDDNSENVRKNEHTLHMCTQKKILSKAKKVGFILHGKSDMVNCMYEYQWIYYLYKPE